MKILKKSFAFLRAFDYISAPRQTERLKRHGEVSEWLKEHAWKVCIQETVSRVRISPSPPNSIYVKALTFLAKLRAFSCPSDSSAHLGATATARRPAPSRPLRQHPRKTTSTRCPILLRERLRIGASNANTAPVARLVHACQSPLGGMAVIGASGYPRMDRKYIQKTRFFMRLCHMLHLLFTDHRKPAHPVN